MRYSPHEETPGVEVLEIFSKHGRLVSLRLLGSHGLTFRSDRGPVGLVRKHMEVIARGFPGLTALEIIGHVQLDGSDVELLHGRRLTLLRLEDCAGAGQATFGGQLATGLVRLSLAGTPVDDRSLASLRGRGALREVRLARCRKLTSKSVPTLVSWRGATALDLTGLSWIDDDVLEALGSLRKLRTLRLVGCAKVTTRGVLGLQRLALKDLYLSRSEKLDVESLRRFIRGCRIHVVSSPSEASIKKK